MTEENLFQQALQAHGAKDYARALRLIDAALLEQPCSAARWNAKGLCLRAMARLPEALLCTRRAVECNPQSGGIWANLATLYGDFKQYRQALLCSEKAHMLQPDDATILHNHGLLLAKTGQYRAALAYFQRVTRIMPQKPELRWDRAMASLRIGAFADGWADYEVRLDGVAYNAQYRPDKKWRGQGFAGRHLVITAEQGFGDAIWAARFLTRVKALGGTITMECRPELMPLFAPLRVVDRFVPTGQALPAADFHIPICSLPGLFTPDLAAIDGTPYLAALPPRIDQLAPHIATHDGKMRVGIVWSGNVDFTGNADRAVALDRFLNAFNLPFVQLYSLQKDQPAEALRSHPDAGVIDLAPYLQDFADTAAAVAAMDLIIMTDSAVAHLAGAMGKKIWLLLGDNPAWLWFTERADSPWYQSMTIFRQHTRGDWNTLFDEAGAKLLSETISFLPLP